MSTKPNHRRGEGRKQDNGPDWEGSPNAGGPGVAKGRRKWRRLRARAERRTGRMVSKFMGTPRTRPEIEL